MTTSSLAGPIGMSCLSEGVHSTRYFPVISLLFPVISRLFLTEVQVLRGLSGDFASPPAPVYRDLQASDGWMRRDHAGLCRPLTSSISLPIKTGRARLIPKGSSRSAPHAPAPVE